MFYVYFRNTFYAGATNVKRSAMQDAIITGFADGRAFDVHNENGTVAWTWEQRP